MLVIKACSNNMDEVGDFNFDGSLTPQNVCPDVTDAVKFPVPWTVDVERTFVISDNTIRSMSTCGLLVTLMEYPSPPSASSNLYNPSVTEFNSSLRKNKIAIEFFKRRDCFPVLASKYLTLINENECRPMEGGFRVGKIDYIEKLLASDLCMSVLNKNKKNQLMAMALAFEEKNRVCYNEIFLAQTYTIMISIMLWDNYTPFIENVGPRIREGAVGYYLVESNGDILCNCLLFSHVELIVKYAKEFLNE